MELRKSHERKLMSLLVGATTAMIALTTISLTFSMSEFGSKMAGEGHLFAVLLAGSSAATLLVMSMLHGNLRQLYGELSESRTNAWQDARSDPLTGLGNRKRLLEELDGLLAEGRKRAASTLYFLDLDQFKSVNDTLGHHMGDALIQEVACRLVKCMTGLSVTRLGGDEFAVIVPTQTKEQITEIGRRIVQSVAGKYEINGTLISVGASVGASQLRNHGDCSTVMRQADIAMYEAKKCGGGFQLFDDYMGEQLEIRTKTERRLVEALLAGNENYQSDELSPNLTTKFQPIFDLKGKIVAAEALVRWEDRMTGPISPQELIAIAEGAHLIGDLGQSVARSAMMAASRTSEISICLNVSPLELLDPQYVPRLAAMASEFRVNPSRVQIEISERAVVERGPEIGKNLASLTSAGFVLSVDDFGATMASIRNLSSHEVSIVKIDHNLIETARQTGNVAMLRALVDLVKSHGLTVVAEGVADKSDEEIARAGGCDLIQGFVYSQAVTLPRLQSLLEAESAQTTSTRLIA